MFKTIESTIFQWVFTKLNNFQGLRQDDHEDDTDDFELYGFTMDLICFKHLVGGDWNIWMIFPYIKNVIIPIDFHIFQRGRHTTNQAANSKAFKLYQLISTPATNHYRAEYQYYTTCMPTPTGKSGHLSSHRNRGWVGKHEEKATRAPRFRATP